MTEQTIHFVKSGTLIALVGNPNCGKTALFNALTGSRQKVANYAGVTVERKEGTLVTSNKQNLRILDLPGTYSLYPRSPDEQVTVDVLNGQAKGEKKPDLVICVLNANNLRRSLRLFLAVKRLGLPIVVALNMTDLAQKRGIKVDTEQLSHLLGCPVIETIGTSPQGVSALKTSLSSHSTKEIISLQKPIQEQTQGIDDQGTIRLMLKSLRLDGIQTELLSDRFDRIALHPVWGWLILGSILFLMFQAVFTWASTPMDLIDQGTSALARVFDPYLGDGYLKSFLVDGLIAGLGGVVVFLPQIVILFFFILVLEESGYLPRAALLLDRVMRSVGLSGRSFIPLLSSFACAIPGIMATRTIANNRDRIVTILIAPLMTCSARLPVYALLIAAFIAPKKVMGIFNQQGLVMFTLYFAGILAAFLVALALKQFGTSQHTQTLMMELPEYHLPNWRNILIGLWQRVAIFLKRVGGIILTLTIVMWFLSSFPTHDIQQSFAGILGRWLNVIFAPVGFNWQICIALVPTMAAREVLVSSLATIYSIGNENAGETLAPMIREQWSVATAYALLAWFIFAPQCLSTLAVIKRETGGWKYPLITAGYLFGLAYLAAFVTYRVTLAVMT